MSLGASLSAICGLSGAGDPAVESACDVALLPSDGPAIRCHSAILSARCTSPPQPQLRLLTNLVETHELTAVLQALLRWIYGGARGGAHEHNILIGIRAARLGKSWGLRDSERFLARFAGYGSYSVARRGDSLCTLTEDLLHAYEEHLLGESFFIQCEAGEPLYGGWWPVLAARSSFFRSLLVGPWAESRAHPSSSDRDSSPQVVQLQWPRAEVARLLRFFHGAGFIRSPKDFQVAMECGNYFGIPALTAHAHEWVADNLELSSASSLWTLIDGELRELDCEQTVDANAACFDYHIKHFASIAEGVETEDGRRTPLHDLNYGLMHRLLESGLIAYPFQGLVDIVREFAIEKCKQQGDADVSTYLIPLMPPKVLFNQQFRCALMGGEEISARTFVAG